MEYKYLTKKLQIPAGFLIPAELKYEDLIARPLGRQDLDEDVSAVNSSIDIIRKTRGGAWPERKLNEDEDFLDLAWHEREFKEGSSFAYVVYKDEGVYIGCFYLYAMGHRTELSEKNKDYDVDASWWVSQEAYDNGYYAKLFDALKAWLADDLPFTNVYYSNNEVTDEQ